jgi:hypothetical protein
MTQKLFSVEIWIAATAYIKADTPEAARKIADGFKNEPLDMSGGCDDLGTTTLRFADLGLAPASLSTAMTCHGSIPEDEIECVYDPETDHE